MWLCEEPDVMLRVGCASKLRLQLCGAVLLPMWH